MNLTEARIVMLCQWDGRPDPRQMKDIHMDFNHRFGFGNYTFIADSCRILAEDGFLIRREVNWGNKRGMPVFYTASRGAIDVASLVIEAEKLKRLYGTSSSSNASLDRWVKISVE